MPSAKILEAKKALVADLNEKIAGSLAGVVVAYNGISVADDTKLRKELRALHGRQEHHAAPGRQGHPVRGSDRVLQG